MYPQCTHKSPGWHPTHIASVSAPQKHLHLQCSFVPTHTNLHSQPPGTHVLFQVLCWLSPPPSIVCSASNNRESSRIRGRFSVQPDPAPPHVPHSGGPGEAFVGKGHRSNTLQTGWSCTPLCTQGEKTMHNYKYIIIIIVANKHMNVHGACNCQIKKVQAVCMCTMYLSTKATSV